MKETTDEIVEKGLSLQTAQAHAAREGERLEKDGSLTREENKRAYDLELGRAGAQVAERIRRGSTEIAELVPGIGGAPRDDLFSLAAALFPDRLRALRYEGIDREPEGMSAKEREAKRAALRKKVDDSRRAFVRYFDAERIDAVLGEAVARAGATNALANEVSEARLDLQRIQAEQQTYLVDQRASNDEQGIARANLAVDRARRELDRLRASHARASAALKAIAPLRRELENIIAARDRDESAICIPAREYPKPRTEIHKGRTARIA